MAPMDVSMVLCCTSQGGSLLLNPQHILGPKDDQFGAEEREMKPHG